VKAIKAVVFWLIMTLSVAVVWMTIRREPGRWIPEALAILAFVVLMQLGLNRVSARKRNSVAIMVTSALWAVGAGGLAAFRFVLIRRGFEGREALAVSVALFLVCSAVSVWSFLHLRRIAPG
jgi:hypothetical protein